MTDKPAKLVQIRMLWHEGFVTEAARGGYSGKTYTNYHDYQTDLVKIRANDDDRPYTKTKARFTYDDGTSFERRVDLGPNDYQPRKEYIGHYLKKESRTGKLVKVPKSIDNISGKKWVASDPPEYKLSDTGKPIDYGAPPRHDRVQQWVHYNDNEEPMYEVWDKDPRDATYINTNSPEEHGKHYRLVMTSYDRAAAQMEHEGEFVRSHETGDEVSYKEHQQYQKRGTWQKGNYARSPASRSRSSNGPGSGWHGEPGRHAEAARMGHRGRH